MLKLFYIASALLITCSSTFAQVNEGDAYARMQARIAARKAAEASRPVSPTTRRTAQAPTYTTAPSNDSPLFTARSQFKTVLRADAVNTQDDHGEKADAPLPKIAHIIHYRTPLGMMAGYVTPDPRDGKKHPAVLWIHGGFGGLSSGLFGRNEPADNDQTPNAFIDAKFVVMCPSFRGQNDNPGKWEMFFGEVNDAVAAIDALSKIPYVDPTRIYVVGHSTGGTMTMLVAEATSKVRAAFSLAGCPDVEQLVANEADHHHAPFDFTNPEEGRLRSAVNFVSGLKTPLWDFDQADSGYVPEAKQMVANAAAHAPFHAITIAPATHFDLVRPLTRMLAAKLLADTGPTLQVSIAPADIASAFAEVFSGREETVQELLPPSGLVKLRVSNLANTVFMMTCKQHQLDPAKAALVVKDQAGQRTLVIAPDRPNDTGLMTDNGVRVAVSNELLRTIGPFTIFLSIQNGSANLKFADGVDFPLNEPPLKLAP